MNEKKLIKIIEKGESQKVEFKESLSLKDEIGNDVSAFSNTNRGLILVGVSDFGEVKGVQIGKKTIEELANYIKQNTDNTVFPKINVEAIDGRNVIVVDIEEASEKPVFFKGKAYKRVGKSTHKLSAAEIRKLVKESTKTYWDEQVCEQAALKDIDWGFVRKTFISLYEESSGKKIVSDIRYLLKSLGCIKHSKPTNAGIILFGKEPQKFFKNSYIAIARYRGKDVGAERLDYKEFSGNLFNQIDRCNKYIQDNMAVMSRLVSGRVRREDIPEYGRFSVRELITNAVCHRNYFDQGSKVIIKMFSDKLEFYNPGSLPEGITPKNITREQYSRNPVIAMVLARIEYIEELGEGWDKIVKEYKEHPLNPKLPRIESTKHSTMVTLSSAKMKFVEKKEEEYDLNERQKKALMYIRKNYRITNRDYRKICNVSHKTAHEELSQLVEKKILVREGKGRSIYYVSKKGDD